MSEVEYTELGRTGIRVSRLCIGTWQASGWSTSDDHLFITSVRRALDLGLNFIDTAPAYGNGHSEQLVAAAIKGHRSKFVLATKFLHSKSKPQQIRSSLEQSLKDLNTDYIDLYQQHWPPKSPPLEETISELEKLKQEGKIRAIGVSNWMEPEWEELRDPSRIDTLQPNYSLLYRAIEPRVLPLCRQHGIAVLPYSPLCQGILAGKFRSLDEIPNDPRKKNTRLSVETFPSVLRVIDMLAAVAAKHQKTLAQTALRWLLDQEGVTAPIVGASKPAQVDENLGAFGWKLDPDDMELLDVVSRPVSATLGPRDSLWNFHPRA